MVCGADALSALEWGLIRPEKEPFQWRTQCLDLDIMLSICGEGVDLRRGCFYCHIEWIKS